MKFQGRHNNTEPVFTRQPSGFPVIIPVLLAKHPLEQTAGEGLVLWWNQDPQRQIPRNFRLAEATRSPATQSSHSPVLPELSCHLHSSREFSQEEYNQYQRNGRADWS